MAYRVLLQRTLPTAGRARCLPAARRLLCSKSEEKILETLGRVQDNMRSIAWSVSGNSCAIKAQQQEIQDLHKKNVEVLVSISQDHPQSLKMSLVHPDAQKKFQWKFKTILSGASLSFVSVVVVALIQYRLQQMMDSVKLYREIRDFVRDNKAFIMETFEEIRNYVKYKKGLEGEKGDEKKTEEKGLEGEKGDEKKVEEKGLEGEKGDEKNNDL